MAGEPVSGQCLLAIYYWAVEAFCCNGTTMPNIH